MFPHVRLSQSWTMCPLPVCFLQLAAPAERSGVPPLALGPSGHKGICQGSTHLPKEAH